MANTHPHPVYVGKQSFLHFIFVRSAVELFLCFSCPNSDLINCSFSANWGGKLVAAGRYKKNVPTSQWTWRDGENQGVLSWLATLIGEHRC